MCYWNVVAVHTGNPTDKLNIMTNNTSEIENIICINTSIKNEDEVIFILYISSVEGHCGLELLTSPQDSVGLVVLGDTEFVCVVLLRINTNVKVDLLHCQGL